MRTTPNVDVLLGLQWGDEGKGKVIDKLTSLREYDTIARFQGGPNAGHTVYYETYKKGKYPDPPEVIKEKIVIRQIPSGILTDGTVNIIGNGCVVDPIVLSDEIINLQNIKKTNITDHLYLDYGAVIITPIHRYIDGVQEETKKAADNGTFIGTTKRGIGPAYTDKVSRDVFHAYDLLDFEKFEKTYRNKLEMFHNYDVDIFDVVTEEENEKFLSACKCVSELKMIHSSVYLNGYQARNVLCEGAQGTMLDIDHGSFPFVTSSTTTIGSVCSGLGIGPNKISNVFGLFKAYCTRVGTGPFPTEDNTEFGGAYMQKKGAEFGAVTGRPRRCGWLDLVELKHACELNGVTSLIMTKADILCGIEDLKVCIGYGKNDENDTLQKVPYREIEWFNLEQYKPIYKSFLSWHNVYLPDGKNVDVALLDYIKFIEDFVGLNINMVSVGPNKEDLIFLNGFFNTEQCSTENVANKPMDNYEQTFMDNVNEYMNGKSALKDMPVQKDFVDETKESYRKDFFIKKIEHIIDTIKCVDQSKIDPFIKESVNIDESLKCLNDLSSYNFDTLIDKYIFANNLLQTLENSVIVNKVTTTDTVDMSLDELKKAIDKPIEMPKRFLHPEVDKSFREFRDKAEFMNSLMESLPNAKNLIVPEHYGAGKIQCIEMMLQTFGKQSTMDFCKLNAFKYLWRSTHKGKEFQDMDKASKYMQYWKVLNALDGDVDDGSFKAFLNSENNK